MSDERLKAADAAIGILQQVRERDGSDAAVLVAKRMIIAAVVVIAREQGPEEARRILYSVAAAQGRA
jgi:hypothetical protein